jgi:hypothetical protein
MQSINLFGRLLTKSGSNVESWMLGGPVAYMNLLSCTLDTHMHLFVNTLAQTTSIRSKALPADHPLFPTGMQRVT